MELTLTRDITRQECDWLPYDLYAGEKVYTFKGATYGCISYHGIAITLVDGENPFYEIPRDAT